MSKFLSINSPRWYFSKTETISCSVYLSGVCSNRVSVANQGGSTSSENYEFVVSGIKVTTGQVIVLEVTSIGTNASASGELVVFEETTGVDPTI